MKNDADYFATYDAAIQTLEARQRWLLEDAKFQATLTDDIALRRKAYEGLIYSLSRSLRWHDGHPILQEDLDRADQNIASFTETLHG